MEYRRTHVNALRAVLGRRCTASLLALAACGGSAEPVASAPPPCAPGVRLSAVTAAGSTTFSWTPACGALSLHVVGPAGRTEWFVFAAPDSPPLLGPIRYGEAPAGTLSVRPEFATPLAPGTTYTALLTAASVRSRIDTVAVLAFTP